MALQRLDLADRSAEQSREAHRLVEKRYAGGLATVAELLGAETAATGAALARAAARYALIDALAAYRRAIGADPAELAALDTRPMNRTVAISSHFGHIAHDSHRLVPPFSSRRPCLSVRRPSRWAPAAAKTPADHAAAEHRPGACRGHRTSGTGHDDRIAPSTPRASRSRCSRPR